MQGTQVPRTIGWRFPGAANAILAPPRRRSGKLTWPCCQRMCTTACVKQHQEKQGSISKRCKQYGTTGVPS
eukprot:scaffold34916_cov170-Amphora_coffeaeformis.AAC.11